MNPSIRRKVLAEWRGLPSDLPRPDRALPMGDLLPKVMQKLGLKERLHESEVRSAWVGLVGDFNARHSQPVSLRDGLLHVQVLQPALRYELERTKPEILRKLKQRFGARVIRDLRFRLG